MPGEEIDDDNEEDDEENGPDQSRGSRLWTTWPSSSLQASLFFGKHFYLLMLRMTQNGRRPTPYGVHRNWTYNSGQATGQPDTAGAYLQAAVRHTIRAPVAGECQWGASETRPGRTHRRDTDAAEGKAQECEVGRHWQVTPGQPGPGQTRH